MEISIAMDFSESYWKIKKRTIVGYDVLRAALWERLVAFNDDRICSISDWRD